MSDPVTPPEGWYPDPADPSQLRWWDGAAWTSHRVAQPSNPDPPVGLRPVGSFISDSFRAVARSHRPLLVLAALAIIPLTVAVILADSQLGLTEWFGEVLDVLEQAQPGETPDLPRWDVNPASAAIWGVALMVLYLFAYLVLPLAAVPLIDSTLKGETGDLDDAVGVGLRAVPRAIGVAVVVLLALLGLFVVPIALMAVFPPLGILVFLALIPVAVYLSVRFMAIYQPLLVIEGRGLSLLRRSWNLTSGHFWALFGRSLLFGLIVGTATNLVTFPLQFVGAADPQLGTLLSLAVGLAVGAASGIVQVAGPLVLYRDLVDGPPAPTAMAAWGEPPPA